MKPLKNTTNEIEKEISYFLASLYFLCREAENMQFPEIADACKEALVTIQFWLETDEPSVPELKNVINKELFSALEFLAQCSKLDADKKEQLLHAIDSYDTIRSAAN